MNNSASRAALWMLCGALAFAVMGAFTHALGSRCDWLVVAFLRSIFMFGATVVLARAAGVKLVLFHPPTLWLRSIAGSFSLVCNFYAMAKLPIGDALTLINTYPLWIVLLSGALMRRAPGLTEIAGVACGLLGVALIQQPHLEGGGFAAIVALMSAFSTSISLLGLHRLREVDARAVVAHFAGVASVVSGLCVSLRPGVINPSLLEPTTLGMLLALAISGTIGQVCLTKAYATGAPTRVSAVGLSQVVFAVLLDVLVWRRIFTPPMLLGIVLVVAPSAWLTSRRRPGLDIVEPIDPAGE